MQINYILRYDNIATTKSLMVLSQKRIKTTFLKMIFEPPFLGQTKTSYRPTANDVNYTRVARFFIRS